ncbi:MAG TPA: hypothetical protein PLM71_05320 [Syntrophorhabdaceae bacterium]|nr:hypothetical protein [Syntrophorhabdaceae bacterium]
METIESKKERSEIICSILAMPVRQWLFILIVVLLFFCFCMVVFDGEPVPRGCSIEENRLLVELNLSREQCECIRYLNDEFRKDPTSLRSKIIKKQIMLHDFHYDPKAHPQAIQSNEHKLNLLEGEFARKLRQTESRQKRYLTLMDFHPEVME